MIDRTLLKRIASDVVIDQAYAWLCEKRSHYHFNNDVWQVRRWWEEKKPQLQALLRSGRYLFRELRAIWGQQQKIEVLSALDALVLKAIAIVLTAHLKPHLSLRCFHLAGSGGMKVAVRSHISPTSILKQAIALSQNLILKQYSQGVAMTDRFATNSAIALLTFCNLIVVKDAIA